MVSSFYSFVKKNWLKYTTITIVVCFLIFYYDLIPSEISPVRFFCGICLIEIFVFLLFSLRQEAKRKKSQCTTFQRHSPSPKTQDSYPVSGVLAQPISSAPKPQVSDAISGENPESEQIDAKESVGESNENR